MTNGVTEGAVGIAETNTFAGGATTGDAGSILLLWFAASEQTVQPPCVSGASSR